MRISPGGMRSASETPSLALSARGREKNESCAANLLQLASLINAELDRAFRRQGLTRAAFNALRVLREAGGAACPYEISDQLSVSRATVTGLLDSLEQRGLVRRVAHAQDRRMLRVEITGQARRLLARLRPEHDRALRRIFAGLPLPDQQRLVDLLGRLRTHVRHQRSGRKADARGRRAGAAIHAAPVRSRQRGERSGP